VTRRIGCLSVLSTVGLGLLALLMLPLACGLLAAASFAMVPEPLHEGLRRWFRGEPPDDPAFEVVGWAFGEGGRFPGCAWEGPVVAGGYLTQPFLPGRHAGVDIGVPVGTPVRAPIGGEVQWAGWLGDYGIAVVLANGPVRVILAHLSAPAVAVGQVVAPGEVVGLSGNTGRSTGPHLHLEVRVNRQPVDPLSAFGVVAAACRGDTGGGEGLAEGPEGLMPRPPSGWRLAALVGVDRAGGEAEAHPAGALAFVWPVDHPEAAVRGAVRVAPGVPVALGPQPGQAWAVWTPPPGGRLFLAAYPAP